MNVTKLAAYECTTLTNALRVAAERFGEQAATLTTGQPDETNIRCARQFQLQRLASLDLAERIANAESVSLEAAESQGQPEPSS